MKERVVAKRYGRALFTLALESGGVERIAKDVEQLRRSAESIPFFLKALSDWRVDVEKRVGGAERIATALGLGKETAGLFRLLVAKERIDLLPLVANDVIARAKRFSHLLDARLVAADAGVVADLCRQIEEILSEAFSAKAQLNAEVDADLIGGFSLFVGDVHYDASIQGMLGRMQKGMLGR